MKPTRLLPSLVGGGIVLFGVGTNVQAGWVLAIAALLIGIAAIGVVLPSRALRGISVAREAPRRVRAGDPVAVLLRVRNDSGSLRGPLLVRDDMLGAGTAVVGVLHSGTERVYRGERTGARRGVYASAAVELVSGAPFGVAIARRTIEVATPVTVYPRVFDVRLDVVLGRATSPSRASAGDIATVREYRTGDPLRHVHWRSTARRGELVVKEFEDRARSELLVVADTPRDPDVADAVASIACSFALAARRDGRDVSMVAGGTTRAGDSEAAILEWGARLSHGPSVALPQATGSAAIVVAAAGSSELLDAAAHLAQTGADVAVVVVGDGSSAAVGALTASGATVCELPAGSDPAAWFLAHRSEL